MTLLTGVVACNGVVAPGLLLLLLLLMMVIWFETTQYDIKHNQHLAVQWLAAPACAQSGQSCLKCHLKSERQGLLQAYAGCTTHFGHLGNLVLRKCMQMLSASSSSPTTVYVMQKGKLAHLTGASQG
jgi:hypothetical protein